MRRNRQRECKTGMLEAARIHCGWAEERGVVEGTMQAEGQLIGPWGPG